MSRLGKILLCLYPLRLERGDLAILSHRRLARALFLASGDKHMRRLSLPVDADQLTFERQPFSPVHSERDRTVASRFGSAERRDEQLIESPRLDQPIESLVAGPVQKDRICIEELIETEDEDTGRKSIEQSAHLRSRLGILPLRSGPALG